MCSASWGLSVARWGVPEDEWTARYMSTPMIKGELQSLLHELVPEK